MSHAASTGAPPRLVLPSPGDEVFHFRLCRELGRGAFARVFLAEQADLAGRPVVLKCSTIEGSEPQTLAQLQHTNIVPIYSVHEDRAAGLRSVCMPYFGGASLSVVLQMLWSKTANPARGEELLGALEAAQATLEASTAPARGAVGPPRRADAAPPARAADRGARADGSTPLDLFRNLSYLRSVAWIVARLADGLQHAHQRGVFHQDVKPSNILLGTDGQPMLLDFNLARRLQDEQAQAAAVLGGTVAYMAPEHLRALTSTDETLRRQVDHRADIYSLGMVLFEFLTGQSPFSQKGSYSALPVLIELLAMERSQAVPSARQKRSDIPWSLESILRKCLTSDPARRYQQAAHLAVDLRRFLEDQPLRYAPELSRVERVQKWVRRHPRLASSVTVAAVAAALLAGVACTLIGIRQHLSNTQRQLEVSRDQDRKRAFEGGVRRALCLVNTTVDMSDHLRQGAKVCQETLDLYEVLGRDDWQERPAWQGLDPEERRRLGEDARELLLLLAWTTVRGAADDPDALRRALALLDRAEGITDLPASRALWEDRALYLGRLGDSAAARAARDRAGLVQAATVRDRYLLASSYARNGRYAEAVAELDRALGQNPCHYWSAFQRGICYQEMGKHALAVADFGTCVGLWPEFALSYFNRGFSLDQGGDKLEAIREYTAAIERDADFVPAYLNRGMARLELKRYEEALADFRKVAESGRDDAFLYAGRGVALEGLGRFEQADESFRTAFVRAAAGPEAVDTRIRWVYGFAVSGRLPDEALAAFDRVLARHPDHAQALYGRAMLLAARGRVNEAIGELDRAVTANPGFLEARRCWAVLQARRGNLVPASQEINACLAKAPDSGSFLYAAACVAAWEANTSPNPDAARRGRAQAVGLLEKAFARGYGQDKAARDPDLAGVRDDPNFHRLLRSTGAGADPAVRP